MRVFVAGGTGVVGRRLVPQLVARGHQVTATTTSPGKLGLLEQLGADAVVMDGLDAVVGRRGGGRGAAGRDRAPDDRDLPGARRQARHQAHGPVVRHHQPAAHRGHRPPAGRGRGGRRRPRRRAELRQLERHPRRAAGSRPRRTRSTGTTERPPHAGDGGDPATSRTRSSRPAARSLRYGALYGPGATDDQVELVRKRQFPLVGGGTGYSSWVHLDDAASATVLAVEQQATGVFNIVDDEPAPASEWLPYLAACAGAKPPMRVPEVAGPAAGRGRGGDDDDRGPRLLQRQGQARARLAAALPVLAAGLQGGAGVTRRPRSSRSCGRCCSRSPTGSSAASSEAEDAVQETWLRYEALDDPARVDEGVPLGRGHPDLDRRAALGPRPAGDSTSGSGSPSRCSPTPTRIRSGRRSWPTRCRWPRCSCSSGSARWSARSSCCARCSGSASPRSRRQWAARRRPAASSPSGRGGTWTPGGRGSRPTAGSGTSWRPASSTPLREGDVDGLRELLAADVQMVGDGGGKAPQWARAIVGADNVARVLASTVPLVRPDRRRAGAARGQRSAGRDLPRPGRQGAQHLDARRARRTRSRRSAPVLNPDKLGHLGPVADAWAVTREATQARAHSLGVRHEPAEGPLSEET